MHTFLSAIVFFLFVLAAADQQSGTGAAVDGQNATIHVSQEEHAAGRLHSSHLHTAAAMLDSVGYVVLRGHSLLSDSVLEDAQQAVELELQRLQANESLPCMC